MESFVREKFTPLKSPRLGALTDILGPVGGFFGLSPGVTNVVSAAGQIALDQYNQNQQQRIAAQEAEAAKARVEAERIRLQQEGEAIRRSEVAGLGISPTTLLIGAGAAVVLLLVLTR